MANKVFAFEEKLNIYYEEEQKKKKKLRNFPILTKSKKRWH